MKKWPYIRGNLSWGEQLSSILVYLKSGLEEGCPFVGVALYEGSYDFILNNGIKYYYYFTFYVTGLDILG